MSLNEPQVTVDEPEQTQLFHRFQQHPTQVKEARRSKNTSLMEAGWTCPFYFLEDNFEAGTMILRPKGIVGGQPEGDNGHGSWELVWFGRDQPVGVRVLIVLCAGCL